MNHHRIIALHLALWSVTSVAMIYLFIAMGLSPYWQGLSGSEIQSWFAGPFVGFSDFMLPLPLLSMAIMVTACYLHRQRDFQLWMLALFGLFVCQGFNILLHNAVLNPALQSGALDAATALATFDSWDVFHKIRTVFALASMALMMTIAIRAR